MLQPMEDTTVEQVDLHLQRLQSVEAPRQNRFRARALACGEETTQELVTFVAHFSSF